MCPSWRLIGAVAARRSGRSRAPGIPSGGRTVRGRRPSANSQILKALLQESLAGEQSDVRRSVGAVARASERALSGTRGGQAR